MSVYTAVQVATNRLTLEQAMTRLAELRDAGVSFGFPEELSIDRNAVNRL
jgi:hypothetical protein